jgi:type VII secretion integral membrane protein EccD
MSYPEVMSQVTAGDICRVTVVGPRHRVDLALPARVPFAQLFPGIVHFSRLDAAAAPDGWVLQRLGEPPLPPSATPAAAGLLDGELIYLRPRAGQLPEAISDDIADEIAGVHAGGGRWTGSDARRAALLAGLLALAAGAVVTARLPGSVAAPTPAIAAGAMALLLLAAAATAARAAGDALAGVALGCAALPYAFLAGIALVQPAPGRDLWHAGAPGVLAGFALTALAAVIAAIETTLPPFVGPVAAALSGLLACWLTMTWPMLGPAGSAALVATAVLALMPLIPGLAFRLARLRLPPVPASAADLRDDALLGPAADVRQRAAVADRIVAGAVAAVGLTAAGAEVALALGHGLLPRVMAVALACALLLRSRAFPGRAQRLGLMLPGYAGLALLGPAVGGVGALLITGAGAGIVVAAGVGLPGRRLSPFWGRAADVADLLLVAVLVPLALDVAGILGYLRGLGG